MKYFIRLLVLIFTLIQVSAAWSQEIAPSPRRDNKQVDRLPAAPLYPAKKKSTKKTVKPVAKKKTPAAPKTEPVKTTQPPAPQPLQTEPVKTPAKIAPQPLKTKPAVAPQPDPAPKAEPKRTLQRVPQPVPQPVREEPVQQVTRRPSDAPQGPYIAGHLGFNTRPEASATGPTSTFEFDPGLTGGLAAGYEFSHPLRLEAEIAYRFNDVDISGVDWSFSALSFMGNVYADIPLTAFIRPYIGVGGGMALAESTLEVPAFFGTAEFSDTDLVFAYQGMVGLGLDLHPRWTITLGYRYFATSDPDFDLSGGNTQTEFESHEFMLGARLRF